MKIIVMKGGISKMKKILGMFLMAFIMFGMMSGVLAQEDATTSEELELPEPKEIGAWNGFRDRMRLAFTFNKEKKVDLALELAEKRLAHIEALNGIDPEAAEKAMERYEALLLQAEEYAAKLEEAKAKNPNQSLSGIEKMIRAQDRIEMHRERAEAMHLRALEHLEAENASEEKVAKFEEFYARELEKLNEIESKFLEKKENAKVKYKAVSGENESEVQNKFREIEGQQGLLKHREERRVRDEERLERYTGIKERNIDRFEMMLENINLTEEQRIVLEANIQRQKAQIENHEMLDHKRRQLEVEFQHELEDRLRNRIGQNASNIRPVAVQPVRAVKMPIVDSAN
jgi:hypothetical protein